MSLSFFVGAGRRSCRRRKRQKYDRRERVRNCMQSTEEAVRNTEFMLGWDANIICLDIH